MTCVVFVSIYCIFKCLQYFRVLFICILIVVQLRIDFFFFFWKMCIMYLQIWISKFELELFTIFFSLFAFSTLWWPECGQLGTIGLSSATIFSSRKLARVKAICPALNVSQWWALWEMSLWPRFSSSWCFIILYLFFIFFNLHLFQSEEAK